MENQEEKIEAPKKTSNIKWKIVLILAGLFILIFNISLGIFLITKNSTKETACTADAKVCPNGTTVGRTGSKCEFAPCPTPSLNPIATSSPTKTRKYLEIPQLGVKIPLSFNIEDAYVVPTSKSKDFIYLKVHSLDKEEKCNNDESSTAALSKVQKDEINVMADKKYSESFEGKIIGDNFYFIDLAQYLCAEDPQNQAKLEKVRNAFRDASSLIEKL